MNNSFSIVKMIYALCAIVFLISCTDKTIKPTHGIHTVQIKQMRFEPSELIVQKGDTVIWINNDIVPHDVTEELGKAWSSSLMPVGNSWSLVVTQSADYYCSIHIVMKGKLVVQ